MKTRNTPTLLVLILAGFLALSAAHAQGQMIGINILLNQPVTNSIIQDLGAHGQVLDVLPQINGVTLRARSSELSTIQRLPYVAGANRDEHGDLASGTNYWNLDAINVTDFGATPPRVVGYDGAGVYIAVIDTGLPFNWRAYFPEERIAVELARSFGAEAESEGRFRASRRHGSGTRMAMESRLRASFSDFATICRIRRCLRPSMEWRRKRPSSR
jgi:hypothetical protein